MEWYGRYGAGPRKRSQSRVLGTFSALAGRSRPWGQMGRSVKASTRVTSPISPFQIQLVAHLGGDAVLRGQLGEKAGLVHGAGKRLLAVDVLAGHDGVRSDDGVRVVRGGDHHGIGLVQHLIEHHAPVLVALGVRVALEDVRGILPVHVAEADDLFGLQAAEDAGAPAADTDAENLVTVGENFAGNHGKPEGGRRSCLQERSSGDVFCHKGSY